MTGLKSGVKKAIVMVMILVTVFFIFPCFGNVTKTEAKSFTVKLNYSSIIMTKGYTMKLKISGTKRKVKWISSNKKIAIVSKNGKVKGKKAGKCTVTAKVSGIKIKCKVRVKPVVASKKLKSSFTDKVLNLSSLKLDVSQIQYRSNGSPLLGIDRGNYKLELLNNKKEVMWETSDNRVAIVNNGNVTALKKGKCIITAISEGKEYPCYVEVTDLKNAEQINRQSDVYCMLGMINKSRVQVKAAPLQIREDLNRAAEIRAKEVSQYFSHTRLNKKSYSSIYDDIRLKAGSFIGENIAFSSDITENMGEITKEAYKGLYESKGHRDNMLNPNYEYVGIGTYTKVYKENGWMYADTYYAQEFYTK